MVLSGHIVALVPVNFPATADWEPWLVVKRDLAGLFVPEGMGRRDVANIVMKVHTMDVWRVLRRDLLETVVSFAQVVKVDSAELALELRTNILKGEMLIDGDVSPVRHRDGLAGFGEQELWVGVLKEQSDQIERERLDPLEGSVADALFDLLDVLCLLEHDYAVSFDHVQSLLGLNLVG